MEPGDGSSDESGDALPAGGTHIYPNPLTASQRRVDLILGRLRDEQADSPERGDPACAR